MCSARSKEPGPSEIVVISTLAYGGFLSRGWPLAAASRFQTLISLLQEPPRGDEIPGCVGAIGSGHVAAREPAQQNGMDASRRIEHEAAQVKSCRMQTACALERCVATSVVAAQRFL
jgi:hypothetical protein